MSDRPVPAIHADPLRPMRLWYLLTQEAIHWAGTMPLRVAGAVLRHGRDED
jgi:hypothetical protein